MPVRVWRPPYLRPPPLAGPRLPGHGGCAARRGPEGRCGRHSPPPAGAPGEAALDAPWGFRPLRAAHGGPGSVCDPSSPRCALTPAAPPGLRGPRHPGVSERAPRGRGWNSAVPSPRGPGAGACVTARCRRLRALPRPRWGSPRLAGASPARCEHRGTGAWTGSWGSAGLRGNPNCPSS